MSKWLTADVGALVVSTATAVATAGVRILLVLLAGFVAVRLRSPAARRHLDPNRRAR